MNELDMLGEIRELIGNPTPTEVSNRQLRAHLIPALEWLASELRWNIVQDDTGIGLVQGVDEYLIPNEILWIMVCSWNNLALEAKSIYFWDREGTTWRNAPQADVLTQYAIHGRKLLLVAPPSALAITTDPYLHLRIISANPLITGEGVIGLSDVDQYLAVLRAALRYCRSHISDENNARIANYTQEIAEHLPQAKRRALALVETHLPSLLPYSERTGGARLRVTIRRPVHIDIGRFPCYNTVKEDLDCGLI